MTLSIQKNMNNTPFTSFLNTLHSIIILGYPILINELDGYQSFDFNESTRDMQRTGSPLFSDWIYVSSCVLTIEYVTFLDMGFLLEELKEILQIIKHSFYYLSWTWCNNSIPPVITADVNIPKRNKMKLFHFARISLQQRGIESHDNFAFAIFLWY